MAYEKQEWDIDIPATPERLNHMEDGIVDASKTGGVEVGAVFGWTGEGIPEGYDEVKKGYSTEEMLTGETWTDGKPVYIKTFKGNLPAPDINGTTWINMVTDANSLVSVSGTVGARPYNNDIVLRNGAYVLALDIAIASNTIMYRNLGIDENTVFEITIKYTKTTDTGNFKYIEKKSVTPIDPITGSIVDGTNIEDKEHNTYSANVIDKMCSYSTEEQFIGYWIDGKPLYRKVIVQNLTKANETISVGHSIKKVDGIIESKYANGWLIPNHPYNSSNKDAYFCDLFISAGNIYLELGSSLYGSATTQANINLTVEYTKTTS